MKVYVFQPMATNSIEASFMAENEDLAWKMLKIKLKSVEYLGIRMPAISAWYVVAIYTPDILHNNTDGVYPDSNVTKE